MVGDNKMNSKEILEKIKILSNEEKIKINYENLKEIMEYMTPDEIIELSNIIGYPVFTRLCMGVLQHKFVLLQDGAAAIIINNEGKILLQSRADRDLWGLPGGCQELGESFKDTIIREIIEEKTAEEKKRPLSAGLHRREDLYQIRPYDAEGRASVLSGQPDQYLGAVLRQHRDQDPSSDDGAFVDPRY